MNFLGGPLRAECALGPDGRIPAGDNWNQNSAAVGLCLKSAYVSAIIYQSHPFVNVSESLCIGLCNKNLRT